MLICLVPFFFITYFFGKGFKKFEQKLSDNNAASSTIAEECISNIRTVKSFATEYYEIEKYINANKVYCKTEISKFAMIGSFFVTFNIFNYGSMIMIIWRWASLYNNKVLELGTITIFILQVGELLNNLMTMANIFNTTMGVIIIN